jgi:PPM family protein phosphatase
MLGLILVGKSDTGLVRSNNEDAFLVNHELGFAALADGMGGAAAGELASKFFINAALEVFSQNNRRENSQYLLRQSFAVANKMILDHADANPEHKGLGCTAELLTFFNNSFALAHVGDSRTYLFRDSELKALTQDHSFVQELINKGVINAQEARQHRMRHVILRAVGQHENLEVELIHGDAMPGDIFLLCSDGLTDMIEDYVIQGILAESLDLDERAQKLIDAAKDSGGHDNVTVVLCEVVEQDEIATYIQLPK